MNNAELRTKSVEDLGKELTELLKAHFNMRMQHGPQQLSNTSQLGRVRRDIARVKTIIRERKSA